MAFFCYTETIYVEAFSKGEAYEQVRKIRVANPRCSEEDMTEISEEVARREAPFLFERRTHARPE